MKAGVAFAAAACAALLAIGAGSAGRAAFPGTNGKIVFVRSAPGLRGQLWTVNADGAGRKRLWRARRRQYAVSPSWSPSGAEVAFTMMRLRANRRPLSGAVWATGGGRTRRVSAPPARTLDLQPTWSPDGSKIAFVRVATGCRADCGTVWVSGADGSGAHLVASHAYISRPAWSPDSRRLAFVYRPNASAPFEIALVGADGSGLRPLAYTGHVNVDPAWSPSGGEIAYSCDGGICVIDPDSTGGLGQPVWSARSGSVAIFPAYSPKGKLAFLVRHGSRGPTEIYAGFSAEFSRLARLTGRPLSHLVWSPDSLRLVLCAGVHSPSVFLISALGGSRRVGKGLDPDWQALR